MEWIFDLLGGAVQSITVAYLIRNYPGLLSIFGGLALAIITAWKHKQKASTWKWNPTQVFDAGLGLITIYFIGLGTYLLFFWNP